MIYSCDFETTTQKDDCRVWSWGVCDVPYKNYWSGINIESFIEFISRDSATYYFHNLKFDASSILNYLLTHDYKWIKDKKEKEDKTFTTLISSTLVYYNITIYFKKGKNFVKASICDSKKLLNMSVDAIAKSLKLEYQKGEIDYNKERPIGYIPDENEQDYQKNDVIIVSKGLEFYLNQKLTKMTQGACALQDYKNILGKKNFERYFPMLGKELDKDIRKAYKGGWVWLNPKYKDKIIKESGYVIDYNSLYPSVMLKYPMPYSFPKYFDGKYIEDKNYPLYIQHIRCEFELKKGFVPTIQLKNNLSFIANEYLTSSNGEAPDLFLTNIDLEIFLKHYDIIEIEYINGWKFRQKTGLFKDYIEKWSQIKINSKKEGNYGMYMLSKIMMNSLYGKFATAPEGYSKKPYLKDGVLCHELLEKEDRKPLYIPVSVYITSYARRETITVAQTVYEQGKFIYSDTDSVHGLGEIPESVELDDAAFCKWKKEFNILYCKYLRQKCYVDYGTEVGSNKLERHIVVAGLPQTAKKCFSIKKFNFGRTYDGKLMPKQVKGGIILEETLFTIKK